MVTSSIQRGRKWLAIRDSPSQKNHVLTREAHVLMLEELMPFLQNREGKHIRLGMGTYFGLFYVYCVLSTYSSFYLALFYYYKYYKLTKFNIQCYCTVPKSSSLHAQCCQITDKTRTLVPTPWEICYVMILNKTQALIQFHRKYNFLACIKKDLPSGNLGRISIQLSRKAELCIINDC